MCKHFKPNIVQSVLRTQRMSLEHIEVLMSKNCDLSARLTNYLYVCNRGVVYRSQVRLVFQFIFDIISERNLFAMDSYDIILCDYPLRQLCDMPHVHLHQLRQCILGHLTISTEGRRMNNPTDSFKLLMTRIFPPPEPARSAGHQRPVQEVHPLQSVIRWRMQPALSSLLVGYVYDSPMEFNQIVTLLNSYISRNRARLLHPMNLTIACIRLDPLYALFNVSYVHFSQVRGYVRDLLDPVQMDQ